jgi:hypothetical protein
MATERAIRYTAVAFIALCVLGYCILSFPNSPQDSSRLVDFSEFFAAAQMMRDGLGHQLYDLIRQAEYQLRVAPVHAFFLRPPFEAVFFLPFTYLSYRSAYSVWTLLCVSLLFFSACLLRRNTGVMQALSEYARGIPVDFGLLFILFLTFAPTLNCLLIGQDSILILTFYTLAFVYLKRGQDGMAGAFLACGLCKFHLVLPFVIVFALRRKGRFLAGFSIVATLLAAVSVWVSGPNILIDYPKMFIDSPYKPLMGFQPEYAANVRGLVYLISPAKLQGVGVGLVVVVSAGMLWFTAKNWRDDQFELSFSAAVLAALLTGFHSFVYDLSLLLLPSAIVCGELARRGTLMANRALTFSLIVLFVPPIHFALATLHVYALMAIVLFAFYFIVLRASREARPPGSTVVQTT